MMAPAHRRHASPEFTVTSTGRQASTRWRRNMITRSRSESPVTTSATGAPHPGVVAGAVLRAARLSAGLSAAQLAARADTDEVIVRVWEDGSKSLAFALYSQVEQL